MPSHDLIVRPNTQERSTPSHWWPIVRAHHFGRAHYSLEETCQLLIERGPPVIIIEREWKGQERYAWNKKIMIYMLLSLYQTSTINEWMHGWASSHQDSQEDVDRSLIIDTGVICAVSVGTVWSGSGSGSGSGTHSLLQCHGTSTAFPSWFMV